MPSTVADQFANTLVGAEVKRIYSIGDDRLNGRADAIRRQAEITWLHVWHEEVAASAPGTEVHGPRRLRNDRREHPLIQTEGCQRLHHQPVVGNLWNSQSSKTRQEA